VYNEQEVGAPCFSRNRLIPCPCLPLEKNFVEWADCNWYFGHSPDFADRSENCFMPSKEDVFAGVKEQLIEALAVDDDQVVAGATLMGDLGAESIDLLDIVYRLEKHFSIKIDRGELVPDDIVNDTQGKYVVEGKLTAQGLEEIKKRLPFADLSSLEKNPVIQNLATVLTVKDMCYLVEQKLGI
jgi:acyl carrier protein